MPTREPIFNAPKAVLAVLAILVLIHAGRQFLTEEDGLMLLLAMSFIPARFSGIAAELPGGDIATYSSFITHMLVHGDWVHLAINSAWLLAFGSVVNKRIGGVRFVLFSIAGGIAGALAFLIIHPGLLAPVVGASGAIAALMAGVIRFLFSVLDRHQGYLLREHPAAIPLMPLSTALTDRRVLATSAVFIAINLLALAGFGGMGSEPGAIAWEAHLGGYFFGLLCFGLFDIATQNEPAYPPKAE